MTQASSACTCSVPPLYTTCTPPHRAEKLWNPVHSSEAKALSVKQSYLSVQLLTRPEGARDACGRGCVFVSFRPESLTSLQDFLYALFFGYCDAASVVMLSLAECSIIY